MEIKQGDIFFGKWEVIKRIGKGNFGSVYEIVRKEYDRQYHSAMKVITLPDENEYRYMIDEGATDKQISDFFNKRVKQIASELDLMAKLKGNSNIVSYEDHDIVKHDDGVGFDIFIRMELLRPLTEYVNQKNGYLEITEIIKIGIDICKALESCEKRGIIHRDIKPQNIFVSDDDNFKLGDFGVARQVESNSLNMTRVGTCKFIAPEVFNGDPYGSVADIYSLGLVLYYYLNNRCMPFSTEGVLSSFEEQEQLNMRRMKGEPLPAPTNGSLYLKRVILKACSFDPRERYANASDFRSALLRVLNADYSGSEKTELLSRTLILKGKPEIWPIEEKNEIETSDNKYKKETDANSTDEEKIDIENRKAKSKRKMAVIASVIAAIVVLGVAIGIYIYLNPTNDTDLSNDGSNNSFVEKNNSVLFESSRKSNYFLESDGKTIVLGTLNNGNAKVYVESTSPELGKNSEVNHAEEDKFYFACDETNLTVSLPLFIDKGSEVNFAVNDYDKDGKAEYAVVVDANNGSDNKREVVVIEPEKGTYSVYATDDIYNYVVEKADLKYNSSDKTAKFTFLNENVTFKNVEENSINYVVRNTEFNLDEESLPIGVAFEVAYGSNNFRFDFAAEIKDDVLALIKGEISSITKEQTKTQEKTAKPVTTKSNIVMPIAKNNSAKLLYDSKGAIYGAELTLYGTLTTPNLKGGEQNLYVELRHHSSDYKSFDLGGETYDCEISYDETYTYNFNIDDNSCEEEVYKDTAVYVYDINGNMVEDEDIRDAAFERFGKPSDYNQINKSNMLSLKKGSDKLILTLKFGKSLSAEYINGGINVYAAEGLYKTENGMNSCSLNEFFG